jgi:gamma-glutamyl-gamma-aminobutyrate hydrolase PuuD
MKKLYSAVYEDDGFPFNALADSCQRVIDPSELTEPDSALIIWGGADISPAYYKHPLHPTTHPGGKRDQIEWGLLQAAIERGIPIFGVCRGAQMACAAAGGFLIQDVRGHSGKHFVNTHDGNVLVVNSIHHQMMAGLEAVDHEMVAWTSAPLSRGHYGYKDGEEYDAPLTFKEPEFVFFPKIRAYAIQWHPEAMAGDSPATEYILNYIKRKEASLAPKTDFTTAKKEISHV